MVAAIAFLAAAAVATTLPEELRRGAWLPLHLALAGGATTAIAGVMPFFSAAIAAAPPSDRRLRFGAVAAVAAGAAGVSLGVVAGRPALAVASGVLFVAGIAAVGVATVRPLGRALGPRRGIVTRGYLAALAQVGVGATLATLFLAGVDPLVEAWARVRVAHAWLNVVGFVSLVIATTLLHFFPTVVGARIANHLSARVAVTGLALGAPLVAAGVVFALDPLARLGSAALVAGAAGVSTYAWRIWRTRGRWTSDAGWHAFAMGGLVSAIAWFDVGILVAAARVGIAGAAPAGWSVATVAGPLVVGWAGFALVASVTHLVPAVGPGDAAAHARQRRLLGRAGMGRLVVLNLGVAGLSIGLALGVPAATTAGLALVGLGLAATAILVAAAVRFGLGAQRPASVPSSSSPAASSASVAVPSPVAHGPDSSDEPESS
jgi:nitrite reductase (NO-forming)